MNYGNIVSDNGLSPGRCHAIIWTNDGLLLIGTTGTNFSEIVIGVATFRSKNVFETIVWKMAAILSWPQCVKAQWTDDVFHGDIKIVFRQWNGTSLIYCKTHLIEYIKGSWYLHGSCICEMIPGYIIWRLILGLRPANERRHYKVTPSFIGWGQT